VEDLPSASAIGDKGNLVGVLGGLFKVAPKVLKGFGGTPTSHMLATKWLAYVELAKPSTSMI